MKIITLAIFLLLTTCFNSLAQEVIECEQYDTRIDMKYAISQKSLIYVKPSHFSDILINDKLTKSSSTIRYHQVDESTTVDAFCEHDEWAFVQISTPEWLNHVAGWIPKKSLRTIIKNKNGITVYTEEDILWDSTTDHNKKQFVAAINYLHQHNQICEKEILTDTLTESPTKSTYGHSVYFVTCGSLPNLANIFFDEDDMKKWSQNASK